MIWRNLARALRRRPAGGHADVARVRHLMTEARAIEQRQPRLTWRHQQLLDALEIQIRDLPSEACSQACPECTRPLHATGTTGDLAWCAGCRSRWVSTALLTKMTGLPTDIPGRALRDRESPLQCPECAVMMRRLQFCRGSNLMVDACPHGHGIYLQSGALARVFEAVQLQMPRRPLRFAPPVAPC